MLPNPLIHFTSVPDPRRQTRNKLHKLEDIITIVLCAQLCGIEDWVGMEDFAHENEDWLRRFLELPNGVPSHDTLSDVIGRLDRKAFAEAFAAWMRDGLPCLQGKQIYDNWNWLAQLLALMQWAARKTLPKRSLSVKRIMYWH